MRSRSFLPALLLGLACVAAGCDNAPKTTAADGATAIPTPSRAAVKASIALEKGGKVEMDLYPDVAPATVENFAKLSEAGFYNGLTFHRVEPGFVVQGGDPNGNGTGGPGYAIKGEFSGKPHLRGTVAMARTADPDSAGSQFYICLAPAPFLDGKYAVFGQVTKGMEFVDQIAKGDKMTRVDITR